MAMHPSSLILTGDTTGKFSTVAGKSQPKAMKIRTDRLLTEKAGKSFRLMTRPKMI
jgi:hypothetical protein